MRRKKWAELEELLGRTDFEGQLDIDGSEIEETTVRPKQVKRRSRRRSRVDDSVQLVLSENDEEET